jgi:hypothetical protein
LFARVDECSAEPKIPKGLLNQRIAGPISQNELATIFRALKKAVIERAMGAEMSEHLGYKHGESKPGGQPTNATAPAARLCSPAMHMQLRKIIKNLDHFPTDEGSDQTELARPSQCQRWQGTDLGGDLTR